jgi:hypothetical protein
VNHPINGLTLTWVVARNIWKKVAEMTGTSVSNMAAWDNSNSESV